YPEKNRQRINRHHDRANVENRRGIQSNDRPQTGGCAKQSAREVEQEQTCAGCEHRTEEANTKLVRAKNRGARAYGESDTRSLAEIGGCQSLRPHPIMSFVKREICRCQKRKANRRQRGDEKPHCARGAHVEEREPLACGFKENKLGACATIKLG